MDPLIEFIKVLNKLTHSKFSHLDQHIRIVVCEKLVNSILFFLILSSNFTVAVRCKDTARPMQWNFFCHFSVTPVEEFHRRYIPHHSVSSFCDRLTSAVIFFLLQHLEACHSGHSLRFQKHYSTTVSSSNCIIIVAVTRKRYHFPSNRRILGVQWLLTFGLLCFHTPRWQHHPKEDNGLFFVVLPFSAKRSSKVH